MVNLSQATHPPKPVLSILHDGCTLRIILSAHGDFEAIVTTPRGAASAVGATRAEARERGLAMVREARGHGG
jgi:hypothetical protein